MTHHELLEELRLADPAPVNAKRPEAAWSSAVVLQIIQQRSGTMQTQNTPTSEKSESGPKAPRQTFRRWLIPAVAGATAVIVAIVTAVAIVGNSDEDVIAPTPEAVVLSSYEAWNEGDFDAWFEAFTDDALINGDSKQEKWRLLNEVRVLSNSRAEFLEPCRLIEPSPSGDSQVQCTVTRSNDFHGAGGLSVTVLETFVVDETNQISSYDVSTVELVGSELAFNRSFWEWLRVAYPEVASDIYPGMDHQPPGFGDDPKDMLIALDYVEEFVSQSRP